MEQFLTSLPRDQEKLLQCSEVKVVLGNETCDLDSAVSAIVCAYYLSKKHPNSCVIPVLNIPASDFRLRTESTHFFKKLNIPIECLTFRDQIDFRGLSSEGKLKLYLVDHNVLTGSDVIYENCVTTVIDHHVRECPERDGVRVKLDFVGSCCTLVAEELLEDPDFELDEVVAELLLGTILVDTINRSPEAGKITPRDQDVLDKLQTVIPNVKGDKLYQELQAAKFDLKDLLNMEILEKDLKMVPGSGMTIAMSSVTMEMEELLRRPNFQADLAEFSKKKGADVVVIMTLTMDTNEKPTRQIAVYSLNRIYKDQIADVLDNSAEENLELDPCFPPFETISVFKQGNVKASRKKVMPILKSFLQGDTTPDVTSKEFVAQQSVSMAAEGFSSFSNLLDQGQKPQDETFGNDHSASSALLDLESLDPIGKLNGTEDNREIPETLIETNIADPANKHEGLNFNANSVTPGIAFDIFATHTEDLETSSLHRNESDNVSKSDNPFADFSSTNLSSVNSSNLFDFITSDSELVDPFSSVEDIQSSLPNQTDTTEYKEGTKFETGETPISENQSLVDISIDNQTVSLAQTSETQSSSTNPFFYIPDDSAQPSLFSNNVDSDNSTNLSVKNSYNSNTSTNNILDDSGLGSLNPFDDKFNKTDSTELNINPFTLPASSEQFFSESDNVSPETGFGDITNIDSNDDRNPFQSNINNPFELPLDVPIAKESHFEEMTEEGNPPNMDYLDIDSDGKGSRPRARKSISLIVEIDQHSSEKLDELDEADFFDKVATPEIQHSGEVSPFVNSAVSTPFEGMTTPNTEGLSLAGSGYPSISTPPNSVMEGSGFDPRDHDLPSFNSAEMVERIHRKKASLGNIAEFEGIDIQGKTSVPYTPQNSFRDDVPLQSVNLILPEMEPSQMEHTIQEKRNSLVAAQGFTSGEDDLLGLSFGTVITSETDVDTVNTSETQQQCDVNENTANISDSAQESNPFHIVIDPVSISNDPSDLSAETVDPFTPANSYVDSSGASFMEGRQSVPGSELFDRLHDLQKQRTDSTSKSDKDTDIQYTKSVNEENISVNNFDPFFMKSNMHVDTQNVTSDLFDLTIKSNFTEEIVTDKVDKSEAFSVTKSMVQQDSLIDIPVESTDSLSLSEVDSNCKQVLNPSDEISKVIQSLDSQLELKMLEKAEHDVVQDVSNMVTNEVIKQAVDDFPDMSNPAVAESVAMEMLHGDTNFNWTDQGSGDSGIGSSDSTQQGINKAPRSPRRTQVTQYSLETDYLPSMDPLHGNLNIVMSPSSTTQTVETDAGKEVVESESFRRISFEAGHETSSEDAVHKTPQNLADISENSVKDMILCQNLETSQDYDILVSDLSHKPSITEGASTVSQEERDDVTSSSGKMETYSAEDISKIQYKQDNNILADLSKLTDMKHEAFSMSQDCEGDITKSLADEAEDSSEKENSKDNIPVVGFGEQSIIKSETVPMLEDKGDVMIQSSDKVKSDVVQGSSEIDLALKEQPQQRDLYDISILKDSESMIDEEEILSSPDSGNGELQDIVTEDSVVVETQDHDFKELSNDCLYDDFEYNNGENNEVGAIENNENIPGLYEEQVIPPSKLILDNSNISGFDPLPQKAVEINIEACSISPDSSKSYNSSSDSEVDLITVRENIIDSSPTDFVEPLDESSANKDNIDETKLNAEIADRLAKEQSMIDGDNGVPEQEDSVVHVNKQKLPDLIMESKNANTDLSDVNLLESIGARDQLGESTLTIETVSPVETPENEHAAGFYEVNPEVTDMERSMNTNLGDNITGFYEVNADHSKMTESDLTQESASPEQTPMEEHSTGFNEVNSESVHVDKTPEISVSMTESFETETSDIEGNLGFYEMNSEIQGTVLQNIEIGDAFSPAESPNDEVIGISYQINPMIPDLLTEGNVEIEENNKSQISLFESFDNTKTNFAEEANNTEAVLFSMADGLVNEAIKGAFETVYEIKGHEDADIVKEIADAMIEDKSLESSDESDVSSTTTEGSYRINCSPVMTPESESVLEEHVKQMKTNEVYVIEESVNEDFEDENDLDKTEVTKESYLTSFSEESEKAVTDHVKGDENMIILTDSSIPTLVEENTDISAEVSITSEKFEHMNDEISSAKNLVRQETVIPDIIISADGNGESNESGRSSEQTQSVNKDVEEHKDKSYSVDSVEQTVVVNEEIIEEQVVGVFSSNTVKHDSVEDNVETVKSAHNNIVEQEVAIRHEEVNMSNIDEMEEIKSDNIHETSAILDKNPNISDKEESTVSITKSRFAEQEYTTRKEIFYTTAGRMSVSIDSVVDPPGLTEHGTQGLCQNPISEETMQVEIAYLLTQIRETTGQADNILSKLCESNLTSIKEIHGFLVEKLDLENISVCSQPGDDDFDPLDLKDDQNITETTHSQQQQHQQQHQDQQQAVQKQQKSQEQQGAKVKNTKKKNDGQVKGMEDTQEWHEDPIPGMGVQDDDLDSSESESESDSDSEYGKPARPDSLLAGKRRKKKILANSNIVRNDSTDDLVEGVDDLPTPDDLETPDDMEGELEWEDDTPITPSSEKKFSDYIHTRDDGDDDDDDKEYEQNTGMRKVEIAGKDYKVDMHVIEPYKKVLSHGGYYGDGLNAIILFCGCYLPDRSRRDYQYVMDNLFLYVISTLELLVAEDYMIVYFHGATPRRQMPSFGWLKRCYQMIDRRLRKNLKALLMVHPTLWLKTVVMMTKPFISSKFSSKLRFVKTLQELGKIVPMEYIYVPEPVQQYDTKLKQQRASASNTPVTPISPS